MGLHLDTGDSTPISLWFQGKSLLGSIPVELGNCSLLSVLNLGSNKFIGSIPKELGNCTALKELYLYDNQLTGIIPESLGNLALLQKLYLDRNQLTGVLPVELQKLSNLQILRIDDNDLDDPEDCKTNIKSKLPKCDVGAFTKHSNHNRLLSHLSKQHAPAPAADTTEE
jgi:Leucine-rich repeat (LRR) protein